MLIMVEGKVSAEITGHNVPATARRPGCPAARRCAPASLGASPSPLPDSSPATRPTPAHICSGWYYTGLPHVVDAQRQASAVRKFHLRLQNKHGTLSAAWTRISEALQTDLAIAGRRRGSAGARPRRCPRQLPRPVRQHNVRLELRRRVAGGEPPRPRARSGRQPRRRPPLLQRT